MRYDMEQTGRKLDKPPENLGELQRLKSWMNMLHEQWKFSHLVKWHSLQKQRPRKVNTGLQNFSCRMAEQLQHPLVSYYVIFTYTVIFTRVKYK